ncbi:hypothetical protein DOY81_009121 [Sarcophaga bullata]|nr:hypothetical protein DOY81_009121 [Sarcophaga bullata]
MKFLVIFALALATVSAHPAFDLRNAKLKPEKEGRITNGQNAENGQFPYQILKRRMALHTSCGGAIISEEYVLTAAHCLEGTERVTVYFGTTSFSEIGLEVTVENDDFIIHEEFDTNNLLNDIGLIRVPAIEYTDNIQPVVRLPILRNAIATGWGHTFDGSGPTGDLQWASLRVIDNSVCAEAYDPEFPSSQICVSGEGGISACDGDSGGPLVLADTNTQIGVMSFSTDSCTEGNPQSFTRITSYLPWISTNTGIVL